MSIVKPLSPPDQLTFLECLNNHAKLSLQERQYLENLQKGAEGEKKWETHLRKLTSNVLILYDLTLEINHTYFQIDALCIFENIILAFEIKNYQGDFHINNNQWYSSSGNEIKDPLLQVRRNESLLRQFCKKHHIRLPIEYHLVFVNPEFMIYSLPPRENIILPPQINRYIETINSTPAQLNRTHDQIAEKLLSLNLQSDVYRSKYNYNYENLRKGIWCGECREFVIRKSNTLYCKKCETKETCHSGVLRGISQLKILFPNVKLTTHLVHDWTGKIVSNVTIQRILKQNFEKVSGSKNTFYI
ncbi:nuclease-like protein [Cytobacillus horneckiae]|uniref:nuclease-related domain-containing protein n=1 Tax=Cytobacillus horneckiae TaxID=549687 RepID=UPI0019D05BF6|nr:nuclease-related domain-containing protein [Cytobacillus horneckiae]MBN6889547.1 NERD domain-containing protein [Cytobacillus horneckiae]